MITKPTLLIDEQKCKTNIAFMAERAKRFGVVLRPHFKTHQSIEIGRWFKDFGVNKITVSSLEMAHYFSDEWQDITVAFPANILEIDLINELANRINLTLLVESTEVIALLKDNLLHKINFYIKINIGNNRAGLSPKNTESISTIINTANDCNNLRFIGFLGHAGQTYRCRSAEDIQEVHNEAKKKLVGLKDHFKNDHPNILASYGDTPSCSVAKDFDGLDEIRPGNFVFYDLMQMQIGACKYEQVAVAMACPIVAIHRDQNEMIVYGGGIHFSKDRIEKNGHLTFGQVVRKTTNGWNEIIPEMYLRSISQEHGIVVVPDTEINNYQIGDLLYFLPVHSCMTADLMKRYLTLNKKEISMLTY